MRLGLRLEPAPLVVTYHPATLDAAAGQRARWLLQALEAVDRPILFTRTNADPGGRGIWQAIEAFASQHSSARIVPHLGTQAYFSVLAQAAAMVGNSSSGLVEAPSFELPVVNIGARQDGRVRAANVIDVGDRPEEIAAGIARALSPEFRQGLRGLQNPYRSGDASSIIVRRLREIPLDDRLLRKRFVDLAVPAGAAEPQAGAYAG